MSGNEKKRHCTETKGLHQWSQHHFIFHFLSSVLTATLISCGVCSNTHVSY